MSRIPKNRQDSEMFVNVKEAFSFEHETDGETVAKPAKSQPVKQPAYADFLTPQLTEDLGKALLAQKVKLYKDGIVDYAIKVSTEGSQIVLKAVPRKSKQD